MAIVGSKIHLKWRQHWVPDLLWWNQWHALVYFSTARLIVAGEAWGGLRAMLADCDSPGNHIFWEPTGLLGRGLQWPRAADGLSSRAGGGTRHLVAQAGGHHPATGLQRRLFWAIPLPHGKANPLYLPFCWCISFPPHLWMRGRVSVPGHVRRMQAVLPLLLPVCGSCTSWRISQAGASSNPSAASVGYGEAAMRH